MAIPESSAKLQPTFEIADIKDLDVHADKKEVTGILRVGDKSFTVKVIASKGLAENKEKLSETIINIANAYEVGTKTVGLSITQERVKLTKKDTGEEGGKTVSFQKDTNIKTLQGGIKNKRDANDIPLPCKPENLKNTLACIETVRGLKNNSPSNTIYKELLKDLKALREALIYKEIFNSHMSEGHIQKA